MQLTTKGKTAADHCVSALTQKRTWLLSTPAALKYAHYDVHEDESDSVTWQSLHSARCTACDT